MSDFLSDKTLLLPFDFSETSAAAVQEGLRIADQSTRVWVLHVLLPLHVISIEPGTLVNLGSDHDRIEGAVEEMKKRIDAANRTVEFAARIGDPGLEIVNYAQEISADLIVMPSHGRTGLNRLFLGSVAERVVRHAECPVMVLRKAKHHP